MKYKLLIFFLLSSLVALPLAPVPVYAHPGRTDSSGGHTCRTNCASWGYGQGEYHHHGGGGSSGGSTGGTYTAPVETYQEPQTFVELPTDTPPPVIYIPTRRPTRIPTRIPTATPTLTLTPTLTASPSPTTIPTPTREPTKRVKPVQSSAKQQGFFEWLFSLFGSK